MPKNRKKFIDKKRSVTIYLAHTHYAPTMHPLCDLVPHKTDQQQSTAKKSTKKLQRKKQSNRVRKNKKKAFRNYFDDDCDYLQHLRDSGVVLNHNKKQTKIRLDRRCLSVIGTKLLRIKALAQFGALAVSDLSIQPRGETSKERKQRKFALKSALNRHCKVINKHNEVFKRKPMKGKRHYV